MMQPWDPGPLALSLGDQSFLSVSYLRTAEPAILLVAEEKKKCASRVIQICLSLLSYYHLLFRQGKEESLINWIINMSYTTQSLLLTFRA